MKKHAKPLTVRQEKVRRALEWLKQNNHLYRDIILNTAVLNSLESEQVLLFHIQHVVPSDSSESLVSRYDSIDQIWKTTTDATSSDPVHSEPAESGSTSSNISPPSTSSDNSSLHMHFQSVVITDVDAHSPSHELRAAAVRHVKHKAGGYVKIPHDPKPVNEFYNPDLFPMIYPTLFPYGIGGPEHQACKVALSFKRHIKHFFNVADRRFQEHYSFLFTAFNIIQRNAILLQTSLKVRKHNFDKVAASFASVSPQAIHVVSERVAKGDYATANNDDEHKVLELMKQVKTVTGNVPGSTAARMVMRNEIRALMVDKGLPSFYITINPADIYNPLVKFLAGAEIDVDNLLPEHVPNYVEQSILVAKNPAVAAKFFNIYMKAFIKCILGYDPKEKFIEGGILGHVNGYYGCVEAQGRGTLHCHMLVWLEGALNPNEIKERVLSQGDSEFEQWLLAFLDDTISNVVPDDPDENITPPSSIHHPCSVRHPTAVQSPGTDGNLTQKLKQKDLHNIVAQCQRHSHTHTCFK